LFTGLIEGTGTVRSRSGSSLTVSSPLSGEVVPGDSFAVDGSCLTVTGSAAGSMSFQCSGETLSRTVIQWYTTGVRVNLERPLLPSDRLHGHLVTGHVDETARLLRVQRSGGGMTAWISYSPESSVLLVPRGSVAVSGVSLTVASLEPGMFSVALIPETLARTTADGWRPGTRVNLEFDLIGKYVRRQAEAASAAAGLRDHLEG